MANGRVSCIRALGVVTLASATLAAAGCTRAARPREPRVAAISPTAHLIFNGCADPAEPIVERPADWPSTFVADRGQEETLYQETIRDWQGPFWTDRDHYQRRFHAVTTGATRR